MGKRAVSPSYIIVLVAVGLVIAYLLAHMGRSIDVHSSLETGPLDWPEVFQTFEESLANPGILFDPIPAKDSWTVRLTWMGSLIYCMFMLYYLTTSKKRFHRKGVEHGSARWATQKEAQSLLDDKGPDHAIILTDDVRLGLDARQTRRNLNVVVIGGSGAGKTRFFVKPNIMQLNTSYVITDPKGELLRSTGKMLQQHGYEVKVFNTINMKNSFNYNPFAYLYDEHGNYSDANVIKLINVLMKNTKKEGQSGGDQFWEDSTEALLLALAFFLVYEGEEHEKNFGTMMDLLQLADAREDQEDYQSPLDIMFRELEEEDPLHPAVKYYNIFKKAAGKTAKSILISTAVRLKAFNNKDVVNLTSVDNLNLQEIGEKKTALFVLIPDSDDTFNFLVAMLYTQLFDILYRTADFKHNGRLPIHVRFLLDEFANIGTIPNFEKLVATMRSREISVNIILQNIAQLKKMYKEGWESIVGNCDSLLFLGGKEEGTLDYIAKALGKETIDTRNRSISRGHRNRSTSLNDGIIGRELMTADEIGRMDNSYCILLVRGYYPFFSKKFNLEKHKNYQFTEDYSDINRFDVTSIQTHVTSAPSLLSQVQDTGAEEEYTELIQDILNQQEVEDVVDSNVEIPSDEMEQEEEIILLEDDIQHSDEQVEDDHKNEDDFDPVIEDLVIEETDELDELNFEDFVIDETDKVLLDDDDEDTSQ